MSTLAGFRQINEMVEREARFVQVLNAEIRKAIIGQDRLVERALVALLADGHILLEGVPGLAKTLLVKTIGQAIQAGFSRIQFTPDLLPADLIGTTDLQSPHRRFQRPEGPGIFQSHPRRRSEPGACQGAERPAGGDAGKAGYHRRRGPSRWMRRS